MEPEKIQTSLPENAYRELKPGEEYTPVMPASSNPKEVTPYSVTMGVVMAVVRICSGEADCLISPILAIRAAISSPILLISRKI